ncbi:MAG TPA: hypothetical protein VKY24_01935 [Reyranella sp.]|nr:hypothetical protein [Reyranella sp.]
MGGVVVDGTETAVEGWASDCTAGCFDGVLVAVAAGAEGGAGAVGSGAGDDVLGGDIPREPAESGVTLAEDGAGGATAICFDGAFVAVAAAADGGAGAVGSGADGDVLGGDTPRELADSGVAMVEDWAGGGTAGCFGGALVAVAAAADGGAGVAGSGAGGGILGEDIRPECAESRPVSAAGEELG